MWASSSACVRNVCPPSRIIIGGRHVVALVDARHHVVDLLDDRLRRDAVLLRCRPPASPGGDRSRCMACRIESVTLSAYMMTRPFTFRAARPDVWISDPADRRKPSLSASRIATSETSGRSSPSRSRLMPTSTSNVAAPQVAQDLDALERLDVRVQVAHADAELLVVLRQVLRHALGQRRDQHALALAPRASRISCSRSSTWPLTGRTSIGGSIRPVGRMICSTTTPLRLRQLVGPRRRGDEDRPGRRAPPTPSKLSGRLSSADGRRKPYATSTSLRDAIAVVHAADLRHGLVALVDDDQRVLGQVVEQRRRRLARRAGRSGGARSSRCRGSSRSRSSSRDRTSCAGAAAALRAACLLLRASSGTTPSSSLIDSTACFVRSRGATKCDLG